MKTTTSQRGVALIIVLLIVAIVSVLATEMGTRLQLQIKRAANIKENNQAYWYAMGAEQYASKSIKTLMNLSKGVVHLDPSWSDKFTFPIEGGGIEAQLIDMQACFNLNGLKDISNTTSFTRSTELNLRLAAFKRLLTLVNDQIPAITADTIADSLADWLDADSNMSQYGAEDSEYEGRAFPYMAANNFMADKTELRLVNGVEVSALIPLLKLVCVIPGENVFKLNVNTVTADNAVILAAMSDLSLSDAQAIIASRPPEGFKKVDDFLALKEVSAKNLNNEQKAWFDVTTQYFRLDSKARYNNATFSMKTVFKVENQNVSVMKRQFGGF